MMAKEGTTPIVNFMTPGAGVLGLRCGYVNHIVKCISPFQKSSSLLPGIDQTNEVYSNNDQGSV